MNSKITITLSTTSNIDQARIIAQACISEKLAACVQIIAGVESWYFWEGEVKNDQEALLIFKSNEVKLNELQKKIKELHAYDTPEIISLTSESADPKYLHWLNSFIADR